MQLLLCAATELEVKPTLKWLHRQEFHKMVSVVITGIGGTAATYHLIKSVAVEKPSYILQAGIAGSLSPLFPLTEVVTVKKDCFADLGVAEERFKTIFDLGLVNPESFPYTHGWLVNPHQELLDLSGLVEVSAATVNEITTAEERIKTYQNNGAQIESMEGAAVHYVALMEGIPFLQIRSISNFAGERDKSKWALHQSIQRLNEEVQRIIGKLITP